MTDIEAGKLEIKERRPMRVKVYEIIDELNVLDNKVWKRSHSREVRDAFKKVKKLVKDL